MVGVNLGLCYSCSCQDWADRFRLLLRLSLCLREDTNYYFDIRDRHGQGALYFDGQGQGQGRDDLLVGSLTGHHISYCCSHCAWAVRTVDTSHSNIILSKLRGRMIGVMAVSEVIHVYDDIEALQLINCLIIMTDISLSPVVRRLRHSAR